MKKGQVGIYLIIGVVILIIAVLTTYLTTREVEIALPSVELAALPTEVQPIQVYLDGCVDRVAQKGLDLLGQQGGWIDTSQFQTNYDPTESDVLEVTPGGLQVPYWFHLKSPNGCSNCIFNDNIPTLREMEEGLADYIDENIDECLQGFQSFEDQGWTISKQGEHSTRVEIGDNVVVTHSYPIKVTRGRTSFDLGRSYAGLRVPLKQLHLLATILTTHEANSHFLEDAAMAIVGAFSGLDPNKLPPISATDLSPVKTYWSKFKSKQLFLDLLMTHSQFLTVTGTNNFFPYFQQQDSLIRKHAYLAFVIDALELSDQRFKPYDVSFKYLNWPLYFDITPSEGDMLRPEENSAHFKLFTSIFSQSYEFQYDISYPVLVEVRDNNAFNGKGYSFLFALESNTRNGFPLLQGEREFDFLSADVPSLFSSPANRLSGEVTVQVSSNRDFVEEVSASYHCGPDSASFGVSDSQGVISNTLPICIGGILKFSADGYQTKNVLFDAQNNLDASFDVQLTKLYPVTVNLQMRDSENVDSFSSVRYGELDLSKYRSLLIGGTSDLEEGTVLYTFTKIRETDEEEQFMQVINFDEDTETQEVSLAPGRYEINAIYYSDRGFTIPSSTRKVGDDRIVLDEFEMAPAPMGGALLDEVTNQAWLVAEETLQERDTITVYVFKTDPPETHEELDKLGEYAEISAKASSLIVPRWQ